MKKTYAVLVIAIITILFCLNLNAADRPKFIAEGGLQLTWDKENEIFSTTTVGKQQNGRGMEWLFQKPIGELASVFYEGEYGRLGNPFHVWPSGKVGLGPHEITDEAYRIYGSYDRLRWGLRPVGGIAFRESSRFMPVLPGKAEWIVRERSHFGPLVGFHWESGVFSRFSARVKFYYLPDQRFRLTQETNLRIPPPPTTLVAISGKENHISNGTEWEFGWISRITPSLGMIFLVRPTAYETEFRADRFRDEKLTVAVRVQWIKF